MAIMTVLVTMNTDYNEDFITSYSMRTKGYLIKINVRLASDTSIF